MTKVKEKDIDEVTGAFATIIKAVLRIWELIKNIRKPKTEKPTKTENVSVDKENN